MASVIRLSGVKEKRKAGRSTIYKETQEELLPPAVKIGRRAIVWLEAEVDAVMAARIAGKSNADIRQLVRRLVAERADALAAIRPDMAPAKKTSQ